MRQTFAILFGVVLVWAQLLAAPTPTCVQQPLRPCCHCGGKMSCCASSSSGSQPAPAIPSTAGTQNQLSLLAPASLAWALPENEAGSISAAGMPPLTVAGAPLYARDCARLI